MENIKVIVSTHQGKLYDEECTSITVKNQDGEFEILNRHIPVCTTIKEGFVKLTFKDNFYVGIVNGLVAYNDGVCNIAAQEAHIGKTYEEAKKFLDSVNDERLELNKKVAADFTQSEKDIRNHLKKTKAGRL